MEKIQKLPGLSYLDKIVEECEFELWKGKEDKVDQYRITYMFNDAVESYLLLESVQITGIYENGKTCEELQLVRAGERCGISGRQEGQSFVVWFSKATLCAEYFPYAEIGHFWIPEYEHFRQVVYELGIIEDKYVYLGENACSKEEIQLLEFLKFAPIRSFYSVPWDKGVEFSSTREGIEAFRGLLEELNTSVSSEGERKGLEQIGKLFEEFCDRPTRALENRLQKLLVSVAGIPIYKEIRKRLIDGSEQYQERFFGKREQSLISEKRNSLDQSLRQRGFVGEYPDYRRLRMLTYEQIHIEEELPFTTEEFEYHFHGMLSKCSRWKYRELKRSFCEEKESLPVNFGFFLGKKNAMIIRNLGEIVTNGRER